MGLTRQSLVVVIAAALLTSVGCAPAATTRPTHLVARDFEVHDLEIVLRSGFRHRFAHPVRSRSDGRGRVAIWDRSTTMECQIGEIAFVRVVGDAHHRRARSSSHSGPQSVRDGVETTGDVIVGVARVLSFFSRPLSGAH